MIRECTVHGYFSDDDLCPACNSEGKFIMSTRERDGMALQPVQPVRAGLRYVG